MAKYLASAKKVWPRHSQAEDQIRSDGSQAEVQQFRALANVVARNRLRFYNGSAAGEIPMEFPGISWP